MIILSNGMNKEITVLKHFKILNDEFIIYQDANSISLGQIIDNKINMPSNDKMNIIKILIGNFISNNYNDSINVQNNCIILSNEININLEEISSQHINFTEIQLNNLKLDRNVITFAQENNIYQNVVNVANKKSNKAIPALITIIIIVAIVVSYFMFKDKIPVLSGNKGGGSTKASTPEKALKQTYEYMLDGNYNNFMKTVPSSIRDYYKKEISEENFKEGMSRLYKNLGSNIKIDISNLSKTKLSDETIEKLNTSMKRELGNGITATECYQYDGTITIKGSKGEKNISSSDLRETWYCKVNGEWGFIFG